MKQTARPYLALALFLLVVPSVYADLTGTIATSPGSTVFPGLVPSGTDPGTLLAALKAPFDGVLGRFSGTMTSEVYLEAGGTLDFYYQIANNTTAPKCGGGQPPCDGIARETDTDFLGFTTATGFRTDGATLPGSLGFFVNGSVAPVTADRNAAGGAVGFSFNPPIAAEIGPGQSSLVLVISTNATDFAPGNVALSDGDVTAVASFEPSGVPVTGTVPEPASLPFLGAALLAVGCARRLRA